MKLRNGDEIEVGEQRYRVLDDRLFEINVGFPPAEVFPELKEGKVPLDQNLIDYYLKKGYDVCPNCGQDRNEEGGTGCGKYHYGTYCLA